MHRKLAILLAGCLAISPISSGSFSIRTFAAEAAQQLPITVTIKDEKENLLTPVNEESDSKEEYILTTGESRKLTATFSNEDSTALSSWKSKTPEIVDIDEDGLITAKAAGDGLIVLTLTYDEEQSPLEYTYKIIVSAPAAQQGAETESTAEAAAQTAATADAAKETAETETASAEAAAKETAATADPTKETAAEAATEEPSAGEEDEVVVTPAGEVTPEDTDDLLQEAAQSAGAEASTGAEASAGTGASTGAKESAGTEVSTGAKESAEPEQIVSVTEATAVTAQAAAQAQVNAGQASLDGTVQTVGITDKVASGLVSPHWEGATGNWSYIKSDGTKAIGKVTINDKTYIFDESGKMMTGWYLYNGDWYLLHKSGYVLTGWQYVDSSWYYMDSDGIMQTGLVDLQDGSYIFGETGNMCTGWCKYGDNWYYLHSSGYVTKGWQKIGSKWYYLATDGIMQTGWQKIGDRWYYFSARGSMTTDWQKIGDSWYYMGTDGSLRTGWQMISGKWYYLGGNGSMRFGWQKIGSYWYYFGGTGSMTIGWLKLSSGKTYYFDSRGHMVTGSQTIDGKSYYFQDTGALLSASGNYSYNSRQEFIEVIATLVRKYAPQYGVKVYSPIIAQAILESAYGESSLAKTYNNFFGLKCGTLWTGKSVNLQTGEEYTPGTYTTISANFRVYDSVEEGVRGYFEFLFNNRTRYNNLLGETDPYEYLVKIKADGYATSSKYVQNTYNVLKNWNLTKYDD